MVIVPMFREEQPVGVITVGRAEPGGFSDQDVALLKTFAAQAVIAIENARLFGELEARNADLTQALERETATSEILRVISRSPQDAQPVFDAISLSAGRLCAGLWTIATRLERGLLHLVAQHNAHGASHLLGRTFPMAPTRAVPSGRAVLDRDTVHIPDVQDDVDVDREYAQSIGARAFLVVPLLRDGEPLGTIGVSKSYPARSPTRKSSSCGPSPIRRSSPSRTCACSASWTPGTATSRRRSSSRRRRRRSCG